MKKMLIGLVLLATFAFTSCKSESATTDNKQPENKVTNSVPDTKITDNNTLIGIIKNMGKTKIKEVPDLKTKALAILEHRQKESNNKAFIMLDKDMWEYEFVFTGKSMTKPGQLAGSWIDFHEDLTYTYGYYEKDQGKGRYTYDLSTGLLLMIDDSDQIKPQEIELKLTDRTLILDGNEIYRDNNFNAKLRRVSERPFKLN